jgi:hypothetical protein
MLRKTLFGVGVGEKRGRLGGFHLHEAVVEPPAREVRHEELPLPSHLVVIAEGRAVLFVVRPQRASKCLLLLLRPLWARKVVLKSDEGTAIQLGALSNLVAVCVVVYSHLIPAALSGAQLHLLAKIQPGQVNWFLPDHRTEARMGNLQIAHLR